jgi:hypothetical protein
MLGVLKRAAGMGSSTQTEKASGEPETSPADAADSEEPEETVEAPAKSAKKDATDDLEESSIESSIEEFEALEEEDLTSDEDLQEDVADDSSEASDQSQDNKPVADSVKESVPATPEGRSSRAEPAKKMADAKKSAPSEPKAAPGNRAKIFEDLRRLDKKNRARAKVLVEEARKALQGADYVGAKMLANEAYDLDPGTAEVVDVILKKCAAAAKSDK